MRWALERDLEIHLTNQDQLIRDLRGYRYYGPVKAQIANHSHDLTYKFRFQDGRLVIKRLVVPLLRFWRQEYAGTDAKVVGGQPLGYLTEYSLGPQAVEEFLIEFDLDFPDAGVKVPLNAQSVFKVRMIGRVRKLERVLANLKFT